MEEDDILDDLIDEINDLLDDNIDEDDDMIIDLVNEKYSYNFTNILFRLKSLNNNNLMKNGIICKSKKPKCFILKYQSECKLLSFIFKPKTLFNIYYLTDDDTVYGTTYKYCISQNVNVEFNLYDKVSENSIVINSPHHSYTLDYNLNFVTLDRNTGKSDRCKIEKIFLID